VRRKLRLGALQVEMREHLVQSYLPKKIDSLMGRAKSKTLLIVRSYRPDEGKIKVGATGLLGMFLVTALLVASTLFVMAVGTAVVTAVGKSVGTPVVTAVVTAVVTFVVMAVAVVTYAATTVSVRPKQNLLLLVGKMEGARKFAKRGC
jgi:hypothetical protein